MTAVWDIVLPDSEKIALLALADCANDEGLCWPSMATLARKCSKSDRTLQKAIHSLCEKGHMSREERPGRGVLYQIHPRSDCTPEKASPPKRTTPTPEAASDKPKETINTPQPPKRSEREGRDEGDEYWKGMSGRSWADTGKMLRKLEGKPDRRSRRKRTTSAIYTPSTPAKPQPPVRAKARETEQSAAMHKTLRSALGSSLHDQWFGNAALVHDDPGVTVIVSSDFQKSWIEDRFSAKLMAAARLAFGDGIAWVRVQAEQQAEQNG